jgi:hypothetical protein
LVFAFLKKSDNLLARFVGAKGIPGGGVEHKTVLGDGDILADFHGVWTVRPYGLSASPKV